MLVPPPGLYVHLPWCVSKCPYCDFNSHALRGELPAADYVDALLRDLAADCRRLPVRPVTSVFFGGGTPSLFPARELSRVLDAAAKNPGIAAGAEITLEANPGAIERGRFAAYRAAGINRVSIGAQSFSAESLARLGRIHEPDDTRRAVREAKRAGFALINLDLMYALPKQTPADALSDLTHALALEPSHLSHYQLTIEPNTLFHARPPPLPDPDAAATMQETCHERLEKAGFAQYEVSAFAAAERCRHNVNYWRYGDYLGIGAGAHGKITDVARGIVVRSRKTRHPGRYLAGAQAEYETVDAPDRAFEYMLNNLRLKNRPVALDDFTHRTGLDECAVTAPLGLAKARGLMREDGRKRWGVTATGWRFLNDLQALFLPTDAPGADRNEAGAAASALPRG